MLSKQLAKMYLDRTVPIRSIHPLISLLLSALNNSQIEIGFVDIAEFANKDFTISK